MSFSVWFHSEPPFYISCCVLHLAYGLLVPVRGNIVNYFWVSLQFSLSLFMFLNFFISTMSILSFSVFVSQFVLFFLPSLSFHFFSFSLLHPTYLYVCISIYFFLPSICLLPIWSPTIYFHWFWFYTSLCIYFSMSLCLFSLFDCLYHLFVSQFWFLNSLFLPNYLFCLYLLVFQFSSLNVYFSLFIFLFMSLAPSVCCRLSHHKLPSEWVQRDEVLLSNNVPSKIIFSVKFHYFKKVFWNPFLLTTLTSKI